jgi:hypothetical protein
MTKKLPPLLETEYGGIWYLAFCGHRELAHRLMMLRIERNGMPHNKDAPEKLVEYFCGKENDNEVERTD